VSVRFSQKNELTPIIAQKNELTPIIAKDGKRAGREQIARDAAATRAEHCRTWSTFLGKMLSSRPKQYTRRKSPLSLMRREIPFQRRPEEIFETPRPSPPELPCS